VLWPQAPGLRSRRRFLVYRHVTICLFAGTKASAEETRWSRYFSQCTRLDGSFLRVKKKPPRTMVLIAPESSVQKLLRPFPRCRSFLWLVSSFLPFYPSAIWDSRMTTCAGTVAVLLHTLPQTKEARLLRLRNRMAVD
jgi:hypothetical protein